MLNMIWTLDDGGCLTVTWKNAPARMATAVANTPLLRAIAARKPLSKHGKTIRLKGG